MQRVSTYVALGAAMVSWVVWSGRVDAQFVTRWVDANGVITFSTSSPPPGVAYEPVPMPSSRKNEARSAAQPAPADGGTSASSNKKDSADKAKPTGDARLKVEGQSTTSIGESQWLLSGKVTNDGGVAADGVAIHVSVLEDGQGNPCLEDHGTVNPSTIAPGESGTFELTYDSPCFFGSPRIEIVAEWQQ